MEDEDDELANFFDDANSEQFNPPLLYQIFLPPPDGGDLTTPQPLSCPSSRTGRATTISAPPSTNMERRRSAEEDGT